MTELDATSINQCTIVNGIHTQILVGAALRRCDNDGMNLSSIASATDLPAVACLDDLSSALARSATAVVSAPPGTGKTTLVPPHVAGLVDGRILVTQPRRVAARAGATRLASLLGESVGQTAGYSVRGERRVSADTKVEFVTAGLLLRRVLSNPDMPGVGAVVLDEVHERHLDTDLLAALLLDVHDLSGLPLVAMSATLAAGQWSRLLGDAPVVEATAPMYPVETIFAPGPSPFSERGVPREFLSHIASLTEEAHAAGGGVLVFLPGRAEIARVNEFLGGRAHVLHSSVPSRDQDAILSGGGEGIVLATSIAESSLTVPGVSHVVDSGLSRRPSVNHRLGLGSLVTVAESRASARQRAGRAGRLGPGDARIAMSETSFARLDDHTPAEMMEADLTSFVLLASAWSSIGELRLLDQPPAPALDAATGLLEDLGAMKDGQITEQGRALADIPVHPRHAKALLASPGAGGLAADVIAALEEEASGDLAAEVSRLRRTKPVSFVANRNRLRRYVGQGSPDADRDEVIGRVVASAYPDRIARARGAGYVTAAGTGATLRGGGSFEWLAIGDMTDTGRADALIRSYIPITAEIAFDCGHHATKVQHRVGEKVTATKVTSIGAIRLAATPVDPDPVRARPLILAHLAEGFPTWSANARRLADRVSFLARTRGEPWPIITDEFLAREEFLEPELSRWAAGAPITPVMIDIIRRALPWPEASQLDELAPPSITLPTGRSVPIDYSGAVPMIATKLQDCFGWPQTPLIAGEALQVHLLSPAGRPLAVTSDLASFWAGPYAGVRADMRGRYPKHAWPENPLDKGKS